MGAALQLSPDDPVFDAFVDAVADRLAKKLKVTLVPPATAVAYYSIQALRIRWSCGETKVYDAIHEMESNHYLKRMFVGHDQRVALESVERYEREHTVSPDLKEKVFHLPLPRRGPGRPRKEKPPVSEEGGLSVAEFAKRLAAAKRGEEN